MCIYLSSCKISKDCASRVIILPYCINPTSEPVNRFKEQISIIEFKFSKP